MQRMRPYCACTPTDKNHCSHSKARLWLPLSVAIKVDRAVQEIGGERRLSGRAECSGCRGSSQYQFGLEGQQDAKVQCSRYFCASAISQTNSAQNSEQNLALGYASTRSDPSRRKMTTVECHDPCAKAATHSRDPHRRPARTYTDRKGGIISSKGLVSARHYLYVRHLFLDSPNRT